AFLAKLGRTIGDLVGVSRPGEKDFIKRVIGLPGDKVSCCDAQGRITVNGVSIDEAYIDDGFNSDLSQPPIAGQCSSRRFAEVTVPAGEMFVMGDHREVSLDARCQGTVPIENIIGRAFVTVWPSDRFTGLDIPDVWKQFGEQYPAAAAAHPVRARESEPIVAADIFPLLLGAALSARSSMSFVTRRRRLRA
ncbi:MAG TPA: signal peptidase I, partial [Actinoplanes sp.]|nr:signal peptidase I [Actinoplanes sp.]